MWSFAYFESTNYFICGLVICRTNVLIRWEDLRTERPFIIHPILFYLSLVFDVILEKTKGNEGNKNKNEMKLIPSSLLFDS